MGFAAQRQEKIAVLVPQTAIVTRTVTAFAGAMNPACFAQQIARVPSYVQGRAFMRLSESE